MTNEQILIATLVVLAILCLLSVVLAVYTLKKYTDLSARLSMYDREVIKLLDCAIVQTRDPEIGYPAGRVLYSLLRYLGVWVKEGVPLYLYVDPEDNFEFTPRYHGSRPLYPGTGKGNPNYQRDEEGVDECLSSSCNV